MSKVLKTIAMLVIFYIIPLLGNVGLVLNIRIILLMMISILMFQTQPEMKMSEAKEKQSTDKNSILIILLAGALSQITAVLEWAYFSPDPKIILQPSIVTIGVTMIVAGMAFRIWAIRTLKEFFTSTVQVKEGHRVIQHGPYRVVRHPSYLGALCAIVGSALLLEAPIAAAFATLAMIYSYIIRTSVEEIALVSELGDEYRKFQALRKYKVIPLIW